MSDLPVSDSERHVIQSSADVRVVYQSHELPCHDRIPVWNDVVWRNYVPLNIEVTPRDDFSGQVSLSQLGGVRIVTSGSRAQRIIRTPKLIAQDNEEYLMVGLQLKGSSIIEQHQRQAQLCPGDFVFWDTRQPYTIIFPNDWEMAVFQFPRSVFAYSGKSIDSFTALTLSGRNGVTNIAATLLLSIANQARRQTFVHNTSLLQHTLGILTCSVDNHLNSRDLSPSYNEVLLRKIDGYISSNLTDPQLSTTDIAHAHGLSLRQLYRIFHEHRWTVGDLIRQRRLERIRDDLANPACRHMTISEIARKWGFLDTPHFNRVFKNQYKMTPHQVQCQVMAVSGPKCGARFD